MKLSNKSKEFFPSLNDKSTNFKQVFYLLCCACFHPIINLSNLIKCRANFEKVSNEQEATKCESVSVSFRVFPIVFLPVFFDSYVNDEMRN